MDLAETLGQVLRVEVEEDGALTLRHEGTFASLRRVALVEGLDVLSLTQVLLWDVPCTDELRRRVAVEANRAMFGTLTTTEHPGGDCTVMLRYNFPAGVDARALKILVRMVLDAGVEMGRALA